MYIFVRTFCFADNIITLTLTLTLATPRLHPYRAVAETLWRLLMERCAPAAHALLLRSGEELYLAAVAALFGRILGLIRADQLEPAQVAAAGIPMQPYRLLQAVLQSVNAVLGSGDGAGAAAGGVDVRRIAAVASQRNSLMQVLAALKV